MSLKRRDFLLFISAGFGTVALDPFKVGQRPQPLQIESAAAAPPPNAASILNFEAVLGPMPLETSRLTPSQQIAKYSRFTVVDDLVLPKGFAYDVIAAWGDKVGDSHFGYNNDFLAFFETKNNQGYLSVNFEYISAVPWLENAETVLGRSFPFTAAQAALQTLGEGGVNAYALADTDPLKAQIREICKAALTDQGLGIIAIQKRENKWVRTPSDADRRITGISGLDDDRYLAATGPATPVFRKTTGLGYLDRLGDRIIGTFGNCAGGQTPWGTVLSAEENFQVQVPEPVYPDGTPFDPKEVLFSFGEEELVGQGNVFGLAGNKYGWIVEVDPANPKDFGTKHTWLGRYRHEAVGVRVVAGKKLAFYSGCDRRGGHIYKFVSNAVVKDPKDKANSRLLSDGMLYAAKFNPNGTGRWLPLSVKTLVNPDLPTVHAGAMLPLPKRPEGGIALINDDADIATFKQNYKTLGDLYQGSAIEKQGAILIDAHYAANAAGATCTARPEDTDIAPDGSLYITFTSGAISDKDGSPNLEIFKGPNGNSAYEYGWIMRLVEDKNAPDAMTFRWQMFATGGEPAEGGLGFANPDNLTFDANGNLWMVGDISSGTLNRAVPKERTEPNGKMVSASNLRGLYGNNSIWFLPTSGPNAGKAYLFGMGPMDCECTGPCFAPDQQTMFLAVQHPGETNGTRKQGKAEEREFALKTTDNQDFLQTRTVPIGSNWPGLNAADPPKPAVVTIYRINSMKP
jgi:uncharacterized protein